MIALVIAIIVIVILVWLYRAKKLQAAAPVTLVVPVPAATGTISNDTTGALLSSPEDGGYYNTSPSSPVASPAVLSPTPSTPAPVPAVMLDATPVSSPVSSPVTTAPAPSTVSTSPSTSIAVAPSVNPTTGDQSYSSAPSTSTTILVPSPQPIAGAIAPTPAAPEWVYVGCYNDAALRALPNSGGSPMNIASCAALAKSKGSTYFGMQYPQGGPAGTAQCWYGNGIYDAYGPSTSCTIKDQSGLQLGNSWVNAVYKVGSSLAPAIAPLTYMGCYKDTSVRALPITGTSPMTIGACQTLAKTKGSAYFGMQYPQGGPAGTAQCWYGGGIYDRWGPATNCNTYYDKSGHALGNTWVNAVYKT